ncbi:MAG: hypothetical protein ACHQ1H_08985 [Nitrososphaerales archaeon]
MPKEIRNSAQFQGLMSKGIELRVVRLDDEVVKLKLRTPDYLYTFKTTEDEADGLIKNAKELEVVELTSAKEKAEKKEQSEKKKSSK